MGKAGGVFGKAFRRKAMVAFRHANYHALAGACEQHAVGVGAYGEIIHCVLMGCGVGES